MLTSLFKYKFFPKKLSLFKNNGKTNKRIKRIKKPIIMPEIKGDFKSNVYMSLLHLLENKVYESESE
jgi:hypothetical protein